MSRPLRTSLLLVSLLAVLVVACGTPTTPTPSPAGGGDIGPTATPLTPTPVPTPRPTPGHEVYGFVPYWEMDGGIASHLAGTDLSTVALFSVTNKKNGTIDTAQNGYKKITGAIGQRMIREAHDRGVRVELVFTSFGYARNERLFGGPPEARAKVVASLVALADEIGVDGINVDVEQLDAAFVLAYGEFVRDLRAAVAAWDDDAQVSVATTANRGGAAMAVAASAAGADRIFLMGYDYHWSGSDPGASAPMDRIDGDEKDLVWSLDLYESSGVPVQRTLLGLPLYGMTWPVDSAEPDAARIGKGDAWIPADNVAILTDASAPPVVDPVELVDIYTRPVKNDDGDDGWERIYVDSPDTLTPKLALADQRGLAGAGFWAIGYERGLPGYTDLIERFRKGELVGT